MPVFLRYLLRLGPLNPIAVRLVQNGSRRARHMYIRSGYLAALILVLLWVLVLRTQGGGELSYRDLAAAGASAFTWIAYLQIALICVLAPVFMAGAIAQESSPRTWDILLTTPLSAAEIVLGNLLGRLFFIIALLLASLPLFALTQYFGGVPGTSIFTSYLIAGCAALFVGSVAISLSVSRLVGKRAVFAFYVSVVSYLAVTAGIDAFLRAQGSGAAGGGGVTWMTAVNPFLSLHALLNPASYPRAPEGSLTGLRAWMFETPITAFCTISGVGSLLLMIASTFTVRSGGLSQVTGESSVPWYRRMFGLGGAGAEHRAPRTVWTNPIAWREAAARNATLGRILARWAFIVLGALWGVGLVVLYHTQSLGHSDFRLALLVTLWAELGVTALVAINMAATAVTREREDGTLDILLTTPITPAAYLTGKLRGLIAYLLPMLGVPLGTLAIAGGYVALGGLERTGGVTLTQAIGAGNFALPVVAPEAALIAPLVVIPFIAFCVIIGLSWSLKSKGTLGAVVATVGVVGVVAGIVGLCGWRAGTDLPVLGPALAALNPATLMYALVDPGNAMISTITGSGPASARLALAVGAIVAGAIYVGVVYGVHANMVRTFDMTVRALAGNK
jgi:ABC-type transport system involved in multi-copper enzyme maturation permease subunit